MAALTWRNIDAPNFAPALEGFRQFSQLLNQGLGGANNALENYDDTLNEKASNEFIQNLLTRYSGNPDQLNKDLQSGAVFEGVNRDRLNPAALELLGRRPEDLLRYATGAQQLEDATLDTANEQVVRGRETERFTWEGVDRDFTISERDNAVAARPIAAQLLAAADTENPEASIAAVWADPANQEVIGRLSPDQQAALRRSPIDLVQAELGLQTTRLGHRAANDQHNRAVFDLETGRWSFNNQQVDRNEQRMGIAAGEAALRVSGDADSALAALNTPEFLALPPAAQAIARQTIMGTFGNIYNPATGQPGGGPAVDPSTLNRGSQGTFFGIPGATITSVPGASRDGGSRRHGGWDIAGVPVGSQVRAGAGGTVTRVARGNGNAGNMITVRYDDGTENTFMHMQNIPSGMRQGSRFGAGSVIGTAGNSGNASTRGSSQAVLHVEGSAGLRYINSGGADAAIEGVVRNSQASSVSGTGGVLERLGNNANAPEAAAALQASGAFEGASQPWLIAQIRDIMDRSVVNGRPTLNEAQAARILHNNMNHGGEEAGFFQSLFDINPNLNRNGVNQAVDDARRGRYTDRAGEMAGTEQAVATVQAADAAVAQAQQALAAARRRGALQPGYLQANEPRLQAALQAAIQNQRQVRAAAEGRVQSNREIEVPGQNGGISGTVSDILSGLFTIRRGS